MGITTKKQHSVARQINFLGVSALPELLSGLFRLIYNWPQVAYNCDFTNNL